MDFLRKILFPFSLLYGFIIFVRNVGYDFGIFKSFSFKTPTIVVGNLSVGGTGKTPQIEYLIRLLQSDYKVAVLSRGYKRESTGFIKADEDAAAELIGDEPFQYHQKFPEIIVCVDADRCNGIRKIEALKNPPDVILLDDAFQHRKVKGGLNILLTSYNNLYIDDFMLPTGDLRDVKREARRAQIIVVTKCPEDLSEGQQLEIKNKLKLQAKQELFFSSIEYDDYLKGESPLVLEKLKGTQLLITGIANPEPLALYLQSQNIRFKHLKFSDHYHFRNDDIKRIEKELQLLNSKNGIVLTTEKDYVRIFGRLNKLHYISIKTSFLNRENDLNTIIKSYVEQSSRDC